MGDNREEINLEKGVWKCNYALVVISKFTVDSMCNGGTFYNRIEV